MSIPMTAQQTLDQLNKWGITYQALDGWETRNRAGHGDWGPVNGFVIHHTGDDDPDKADLDVIKNGRSDLAGPLAQFGCDDQGTIWLVGCGRANHAGGGDPHVLDQVVNESYGDYPDPPHFHEGSPGQCDGNVHFYGVETFYSGDQKPTADAYDSIVQLSAAICDFHDWTSRSVIGHKEWSDWKHDPGHVDMKVFRADVAAAIAAGPGSQSKTTPPPHERVYPLIDQAKVLLKKAEDRQPDNRRKVIEQALALLDAEFTETSTPA